MDPEDIFLCHQCGKLFYKLSTLESHARWKHMEKSNDFICHQCGRTFQKKFNLIKHLASGVHDVPETVKCTFCNFKSVTRKIMCEHYQHFHGITLKERNVYFKTEQEFHSWKNDLEHNTRARFVKMSSSRRRKNGFLRCTYFCHRDGNFIPKGKNLRHLKLKGSNKINAHCPAKMEVEIGENIVIVSFIDTHLGHELDISRMGLDHADRTLIAKKLTMGVPFETILSEINSLAQADDPRRANLLTRKDLWNIVETFKINPKSVVYSKTRARRKKKMDQLRKEPVIESVETDKYISVINEHSNLEENEVFSVVEEVESGRNQILINESDGNNLFICPIVIKDENDECIEQYAVLSDENVTDDSSYLIINNKDELQSMTDHHVIFSEEGSIQVCEDSEVTKDGKGGVILLKGRSNMVKGNFLSSNGEVMVKGKNEVAANQQEQLFENVFLLENSIVGSNEIPVFEVLSTEEQIRHTKTINYDQKLKRIKRFKDDSSFLSSSTVSNNEQVETCSGKSYRYISNIEEINSESGMFQSKELLVENNPEFEIIIGNDICQEYILPSTEIQLGNNTNLFYNINQINASVPFEKTVKQQVWPDTVVKAKLHNHSKLHEDSARIFKVSNKASNDRRTQVSHTREYS